MKTKYVHTNLIRYIYSVLRISNLAGFLLIFSSCNKLSGRYDMKPNNPPNSGEQAEELNFGEPMKNQLSSMFSNEVIASGTMTALHYALKQGNTKVGESLISLPEETANRGNVHSKCKSGYVPLYYASFGGHTEAVKVLLKAGARLEERSDNGKTALRCASDNGHKAVVKVLLEAGADPDALDKHGKSSLHFVIIKRLLCIMSGDVAKAKKYLEIMGLLIEHGANLEAEDHLGKTPMFCALASEDLLVVNILKASGALVTKEQEQEIRELLDNQ